jgi:hypothetical protein
MTLDPSRNRRRWLTPRGEMVDDVGLEPATPACEAIQRQPCQLSVRLAVPIKNQPVVHDNVGGPQASRPRTVRSPESPGPAPTRTTRPCPRTRPARLEAGPGTRGHAGPGRPADGAPAFRPVTTRVWMLPNSRMCGILNSRSAGIWTNRSLGITSATPLKSRPNPPRRSLDRRSACGLEAVRAAPQLEMQATRGPVFEACPETPPSQRSTTLKAGTQGAVSRWGSLHPALPASKAATRSGSLTACRTTSPVYRTRLLGQCRRLQLPHARGGLCVRHDD